MNLTNLRFFSTGLFSVSLGACGSIASSGSSSTAPSATDGGSAASSVALPDTDAGAITELQPNTWTWVEVPQAHCRDGSSTGIGVNINPASKKLMIFLDGGGACFNALTCAVNPSCFADFTWCGGNFPLWLGGGLLPGRSFISNDGVFNRADAANPVKDWNFVYVPYCTGDEHMGYNSNGLVPQVGAQQFVGYANMHLFLERIVPTFPGLTQVLLTGMSAGGLGAMFNYPQVAKAFGSVPVYDLDDSGPLMKDPYLAKCQQDEQRKLWGYDQTVLAECGADCPDPTNATLDFAVHVAKKYPNAAFGLIDSTGDSAISSFFGYGANNCSGLTSAPPTPLTQATFTAGLTDIRTKLMAYPNFGAFLFDGTEHTTISRAPYTAGGPSPLDTRTAGGGTDGGGVALTDWIAQLANDGKVTNVGP
jgi:hypothetical protein